MRSLFVQAVDQLEASRRMLEQVRRCYPQVSAPRASYNLVLMMSGGSLRTSVNCYVTQLLKLKCRFIEPNKNSQCGIMSLWSDNADKHVSK